MAHHVIELPPLTGRIVGMPFADWCVRALLNVKPDVWPAEPIEASKPFKWQTRRVMKEQPPALASHVVQDPDPNCRSMWEAGRLGIGVQRGYVGWRVGSPYRPGDVAYVREGLRRMPYPRGDRAVYEAWRDAKQVDVSEGIGFEKPLFWRWKRDFLPSIFMPRVAARLWLRVVGVRCERLRKITPDDCISEGCMGNVTGWARAPAGQESWPSFPDEWDVLNGKRSGCAWPDDPWVWVYDLMRIGRAQ